jgi:hypothetical protein
MSSKYDKQEYGILFAGIGYIRECKITSFIVRDSVFGADETERGSEVYLERSF